jgi:hypothetical protein
LAVFCLASLAVQAIPIQNTLITKPTRATIKATQELETRVQVLLTGRISSTSVTAEPMLLLVNLDKVAWGWGVLECLDLQLRQQEDENQENSILYVHLRAKGQVWLVLDRSVRSEAKDKGSGPIRRRERGITRFITLEMVITVDLMRESISHLGIPANLDWTLYQSYDPVVQYYGSAP